MTDKLQTSFTLKIDQEPGLRIDNFLAQQLDEFSRSKISKLIKDQFILVNGQHVKPSYKLEKNDTILVEVPVEKPKNIISQAMDLDIIYEDEYYIAVNKQKGLTVHPGAGVSDGTLVNGLMHYTKNLSTVGGFDRPGLVHRLDKDTTGVLICAKNDEAHWKMSELFSSRDVYKEYRTIVWGKPHCESIIDKPLARSRKDRKKYAVQEDGKTAKTEFEVLKNWEILSLLKIILHTGRTHQIRVHMKHCHAPVLGDSVYGNDDGRIKGLSQQKREMMQQILKTANRQMLHSYKIGFIHPFTHQEIVVTAPMPADFEQVIELLKKNEELLVGY